MVIVRTMLPPAGDITTQALVSIVAAADALATIPARLSVKTLIKKLADIVHPHARILAVM